MIFLVQVPLYEHSPILLLVNSKMRYRLLIEEKDKLIKELHDER